MEFTNGKIVSIAVTNGNTNVKNVKRQNTRETKNFLLPYRKWVIVNKRNKNQVIKISDSKKQTANNNKNRKNKNFKGVRSFVLFHRQKTRYFEIYIFLPCFKGRTGVVAHVVTMFVPLLFVVFRYFTFS